MTNHKRELYLVNGEQVGFTPSAARLIDFLLHYEPDANDLFGTRPTAALISSALNGADFQHALHSALETYPGVVYAVPPTYVESRTRTPHAYSSRGKPYRRLGRLGYAYRLNELLSITRLGRKAPVPKKVEPIVLSVLCGKRNYNFTALQAAVVKVLMSRSGEGSGYTTDQDVALALGKEYAGNAKLYAVLKDLGEKTARSLVERGAKGQGWRIPFWKKWTIVLDRGSGLDLAQTRG